ncbi:hypothetical protein HJFPF1_00258 [Paramyrothecium foliicola]|nr:hypothetical protein HJFPF1_00258 [Paramyrothecium foliicola]
MPVTLTIVDHAANTWSRPSARTADDLFEASCAEIHMKGGKLMQSSLDEETFRDRCISPSNNGFVRAVFHAYSDHHHLTIRPDDIWIAVLTQFNFYINANAENLREHFVSHEGQKELMVVTMGSLRTVNLGMLAEEMTKQIAANVKDLELRSWIMPSFSTTTNTDDIVASVLFMGTMQKYFNYTMRMACGIPSVTLLGEASDWEDMLERLNKFDDFGEEASLFAEMLRPILGHIILSFEQPSDPEVVSFWNKIITSHVRGSGKNYITGWLGAFCFWDTKGIAKRRHYSAVGGVNYPKVDLRDVPDGFASVPVTVDDNGKVYKCTMTAGFLGIEALPQSLDPAEMLRKAGALKQCTVLFPRTIRDAMAVVKLLGEKYLWVDAVCIIQDDEEMRHDTIHNMNAVFANATLTIVAADGGDANAGLRGVHLNSHGYGGLCDTLWNTRGWTFQEYLFSQKRLIFVNDSVRWECPKGCFWEEHCLRGSMPTPETSWAYDYDLIPIRKTAGWADLKFPNMVAFEHIVRAFGGRSFTYADDAMSAFSGTLTGLSRGFVGGFLWATPVMFLDLGLVWKSSKLVNPIVDGTLDKTNTKDTHQLGHGQASKARLIIIYFGETRIGYYTPTRNGSTISTRYDESSPSFVGLSKRLKNSLRKNFHFATSGTEGSTVTHEIIHLAGGEAIGRFWSDEDDEGDQDVVVELVAISMKYKAKGLERFIQPLGEEVPQIYNVLWVDWIDGIAYRKGIGEVDRVEWERQQLEHIELILG